MGRMELFTHLIHFEQILWVIKQIYQIKSRDVDELYLKTLKIDKEKFSSVVDYLNHSLQKYTSGNSSLDLKLSENFSLKVGFKNFQ